MIPTSTNSRDWRPTTLDQKSMAVLAVGTLFVVQLISAARLQLMFDEAYYRLWARYLDWGFHDHPPLVALWIRLSTTLFGQSEVGVRALGVVATAFGALAVWTMASDIFNERRQAILATLIWTACPLVGIGGVLVTPDTPLLFGWTIALWALCRLYRTNDWRWWLVVGLGAGLALQAKYTALFLGPGILLAMATVPTLQRWWTHPAPYVGGVIALGVFAPNIWWNSQHNWQTFAKQFGRIADTEWTLKYLFEFFGSQIGLLNPLTFILVVAGLVLAVRRLHDGGDESRRLLLALVSPLLLYFTFHSLHDRVQGNWLAPLYPLFALMAADAAVSHPPWPNWPRKMLTFAAKWFAPVGWAMTLAVYAQAHFALLPLSPRSDPTTLLAGWRELAHDVDALAQREGADYVATQGYALTSLLKVYSGGNVPVIQYNERIRWLYDTTEPRPDPLRTGLSIVEARRASDDGLRRRYASAEEIARLDRKRDGRIMESYVVYRLKGPKGKILE